MKTITLTLFSLISFSLVAGGPWLNKKKSGFFQVQSTFPASSYNLLFLENGKEASLKRGVLDYTFQAYLEYGLTDKIDIISSLPYKVVSTSSFLNNTPDSLALKEGNLNGLGNYKIGIKHQLINKKILIATSIVSNLNTITEQSEKGLTTGYNANSIGAYLHVGKSFSAKTYSFLDVGINAMSNDFSSYLDVHYEIGYQVKNSLWTALTFDVRESFKDGNYHNPNLKETGLYTNDQEYFAYGLKASYELKNKIGFTAATFGAFSGNYVAKVATFSIGVYKKW
ncbi:MAG: hypothetical protein ACPGSO_06160 [Vicingaceae bacterium]